jgi:mono/diheme cytochrome c family protein
MGLAMLVVAALCGGCYRGKPSTKPPLHVVPNMDSQPRHKAQGQADFFEDGAAMRTPPEHTIARGFLRENSAYYAGKTANGEFVDKIPTAESAAPRKITTELVMRGKERYSIYCVVCHDATGYAQGIVPQRSDLQPTSFHDDRLRTIADGHIYNVITNGSDSKLMQSYRHQITVEDRWAIVAYVRALQRSQNASEKEFSAGTP